MQKGILEELSSTNYWLYVELTAIPISAETGHPQNFLRADWHFYVLLILQIGILEEFTATNYWLYVELKAITIIAHAQRVSEYSTIDNLVRVVWLSETSWEELFG